MVKPFKDLFPLPTNYFKPLQLTAADVQQYRRTAADVLKETLQASEDFRKQNATERQKAWTEVKQRDRLIVYRRRHGFFAGRDPSGWSYLCVGKLDGTLDEVLCGRYQETTDELRRMCAVYRPDLVDCQVLKTIETQTPEKPFHYLGFKWMTVVSASSAQKLLVKNRDVCWLESLGITKDSSGREVGYAITHSVDLACCPPFDPAHCVRARLYVCYLFRQSKSGGVRVFMRAKAQVNGIVMNRIADLKCATLWLHVQHSSKATYAMIGSRLVKSAGPPSNESHRGNHPCEICGEKTLRLLAKRTECSVCHRSVCSKCIIKLRVLSPEHNFLAKHHKHFCNRCVAYFHEVDLRDPGSLDYVASLVANGNDPTPLYSQRRVPVSVSTSSISASMHGDSVWSTTDSSTAYDSSNLLLATSQRSTASRSTASPAGQQLQSQSSLVHSSVSSGSAQSDYGPPHAVSSSERSSFGSSCPELSETSDCAWDQHVPACSALTVYSAPSRRLSFEDQLLDHRPRQSSLPRCPSAENLTANANIPIKPAPLPQNPWRENNPNPSHDDMLLAMIHMNRVAEAAQRILDDNDRLARQIR